MKTQILPEDVFECIWIKKYYTETQFSKMYGIDSSKTAEKLLKAMGYMFRSDEWEIESARKQSLEEILFRTKEISTVTTEKKTVKLYLKKLLANICGKIGDYFCEAKEKLNYSDNKRADAIAYKPVYDTLKITSRATVILVGVFAFILVLFIFLHFDIWIEEVDGVKKPSTISQFVFSGISVLIGVVTTYITMNQSSQIDYHKERLAVMPVFSGKYFREVDICNKGFFEYLSDTFGKQNIAYWNLANSEEKIGLICIMNTGKGGAYNVEVEGDWDDFENPKLEFFSEKDEKYIFLNKLKYGLVIRFRDLYGNFYTQRIFKDNNNVSYTHSKVIDLAAEPPELIFKTPRIRYTQ